MKGRTILAWSLKAIGHLVGRPLLVTLFTFAVFASSTAHADEAESASVDAASVDAAVRRIAEAFEKIAFYGDMRLRHESSFALDNRSDRHRERVRVRLGVNYQVLDEILVGARIVTEMAAIRTLPTSPSAIRGIARVSRTRSLVASS